MIPFKQTSLPSIVSEDKMEEIYNLIKTPHKLGAVCKRENEMTDSPSVFRLGEKWYMMYLTISKDCAASGYNTWLSESDDLVHWKPIGTVLDRDDKNNWDSKQIAGYLALPCLDFYGDCVPLSKDGKYLVTYLGGNNDGYEPVPLFIGLAETENLLSKDSYLRSQKPLFSPEDPDRRDLESLALYRSYIFKDTDAVTGYPYVMAYNAKADDRRERIFLAVSCDAKHWERYGDSPIFDGTVYNKDNKISADAQIIKIKDVYVMIYFSFTPGTTSYSTFACSYDLIHWKPWDGEPLIKSEYEFENEHAHKSYIICCNDVVYNYYCAVNTGGERFIALATSKPLPSIKTYK